jgi:hypothetical protein
MYKVVVCPLCSLKFKQEKRFYEHLLSKHSIDDPEKLYIERECGGKAPTCQCSDDCNEALKWSGWKHGYTSKFVRGHNAKIQSSFKDPEFHKKASEKRVKGYADGTLKSWNDGLTKETDERIASSAKKIKNTLNDGYRTGRLVDWRLNNPKKAREVASKISHTKKRLFASGALKSWNEGTAKDTSVLSSAASQKLLFRCTVCGQEFSKTLGATENCPKCSTCYPNASKAQLEIFDFVKATRDDAILSDRTLISPLEIDVLVPNLLAVEYNGLWRHSERFLSKDYATNKLRACQRAGIQLFSIYEDEWRDKRCIVEAMLRHRLGVCDRKIGARECSIVELHTNERREFFRDNHIDGDVPASKAFALKSNEQVVAAMSLRRPMHSKYAGMLEIARFCVLRGVSVPGALSRLAAHVNAYRRKVGATGLMTYVDARIGAGRGYEAAGFKLVSETAPRFHWTDFSSRFNRFMFRADAKRGLSEATVAAEAGVVKIWSCPNLIFVSE